MWLHAGPEANPKNTSPRLRLHHPDNPVLALGLAVNHLMAKPAFANLKFGEWSRILVGQINRGHFCFVIDNRSQVQGFMGWASSRVEKAEAWVEERRGLSFEDCTGDDCLIFNAWSASSTRVHRYMADEARKLIADKQTVYFKRYYKDGTTRPAHLTVNQFVGGHIPRRDRTTAGSAPASRLDSVPV